VEEPGQGATEGNTTSEAAVITTTDVARGQGSGSLDGTGETSDPAADATSEEVEHKLQKLGVNEPAPQRTDVVAEDEEEATEEEDDGEGEWISPLCFLWQTLGTAANMPPEQRRATSKSTRRGKTP
jgi:RNA-binding protein NOB1